MNAYYRTLSDLLNVYKERFLSENRAEHIYEARYKYKSYDEHSHDEWLRYSASEEFACTLDRCKKIAKAKCPEGKEPISEDPLLTRSFLPSSRLEANVTYKPCHTIFPYGYDVDMDAYCRLGLRLANIGRDQLPSEWIRAHANDYEG